MGVCWFQKLVTEPGRSFSLLGGPHCSPLFAGRKSMRSVPLTCVGTVEAQQSRVILTDIHCRILKTHFAFKRHAVCREQLQMSP